MIVPGKGLREPGRRVAVLGAGVGGLTAAQELAQRGFQVSVYERRDVGGRSRSVPVPGTGTGGRRDLPGEHGFRFFPGFYRHLLQTMRRIPFPGNARGVYDNLVATNGVFYPRGDGRADLTVAVPESRTPAGLVRAARDVLAAIRSVPAAELLTFSRQLAMFLTSCDERRLHEWERVSWWDFVRAEGRSPAYRQLLAAGLTEHLVAAKARLASTRTMGTLGEAYLCVLTNRGKDRAVGSVLDGPTTETWIDPWARHLRDLGVRLLVGWEVEVLEVDRGRVAAAVVRDPAGGRRRETADWFVCALPAPAALRTWGSGVLAADPRLAGVGRLRTEYMSGIQFYLRRRVPVIRGFVEYVESPWALVSISQAQFWRGRELSRCYGDGTVEDCLSVNIASWDTPGILYGRPAACCTPDEIAREVWAQVKAGLEDTGESLLPDGILHSWSLDPAIHARDGGGEGAAGRLDSEEPVLVNTPGSWADRPEAVTAVPNLFLAADYVRTTVDLATMEGANEAARRAVNGLLEAAASPAPRCELYELHRPLETAPWRWIDARRHRRGRPHLLDRPDAPWRAGA